ncbi:MAG: endonuclease [Paludibacteraceae bacterium]|nr:endonuclease [Paludibacteraceae bacterium]
MKKKLFLLWMLSLFCFVQLWAEAGIWHSSINISVNGESVEYGITNSDAFVGDSEFPICFTTSVSELKINSVTVDVWKDKKGNICGGEYNVTVVGASNYVFATQKLNITWESEETSEYGSLNQVWKNTEGAIIDVSTLSPGIYTLIVEGKMIGSLSNSDDCDDDFIDQTISCQFVIENEASEEILLTSSMDGFVALSVVGEQNWYWDNDYKFAKISGYKSGINYANEDWLISKSFDLSEVNSATLSFTHIINYAVDMPSEQTLWISTDYVQNTNPQNATWSQLTGFSYPNGSSWKKVESGEINIPNKFLKENVVFAFKYTSTTSGAATWEVYNFRLATSGEVKIPIYDVKAVANNTAYGTVSGSGSYEEGSIVTLTATPFDGYEFISWNDGVTENPRQITVTENVIYTAYFEEIEKKPACQDYYMDIEGKFGATLKTALNNIIKNHTDVGYGGLWRIYKETDYKDGKVWDMYSTCNWTYSSDQCGGGGYSDVCDCYNREHTIPQSWFDEKTPMKSDAFHVYPTDGKVNSIRSNYPHGETNASPIGGKALGKIGSSSVSGYSGTVYEPDDEYKGDIARTYFYFVTCYEDKLSGFDKNNVLTGDTYPSLTYWFYNLMLDWHREDPVSKKETDRNEAVYKHQKNRNPFIDYPELAEHIWGDKKSSAFYFNSTAIKDIEFVKYDVFVANGRISISNLNGEQITLFDLSGRMLYSTETTTSTYELNVSQKGVYLLRINSSVTKIIVQ